MSKCLFCRTHHIGIARPEACYEAELAFNHEQFINLQESLSEKIGEIARLKARNELLEKVAEAAKLYAENYNACLSARYQDDLVIALNYLEAPDA